MILLRLLILLAMCVAAHGTSSTCGNTCGLRPKSYSMARVVGGSYVLPGTQAWAGIVSIQKYWSPQMSTHICGGSLIRPQWVLTAAHCFLNRTNPLKEWAVVAGTTMFTDRGPNAQMRRIKRVRIHEKYDFNLYDVAVVELEKPMTCSPTVQLACLPNPTVRVPALKNCYVAGWGDIIAKSHGISRADLKEAKVLLIDTQLCNSSDWYGGTITEYNVCAGYPGGGTSTCQGDSGGPLVCKDNKADIFWQVGVTSWAIGCARPKYPSVFMSTQYFRKWILEKIGESTGVAVTTRPVPPSPVPTPAQPCVFPREKLRQFFNLLQELLKFLRAQTA